jgi:hypothetical protein
VTRRFDQQPGSDETLLALYDAVVAAEELDLTEEAGAVPLEQDLTDAVEAQAGGPADAVDDADEERPSMSQAVGVVEHLLGGHPID